MHRSLFQRNSTVDRSIEPRMFPVTAESRDVQRDASSTVAIRLTGRPISPVPFSKTLTNIHVRPVLVISRRADRRRQSEFVFDVVGPATGGLPVGPKAARAYVLLVAALAGVGPLVRV